jgi:hypothetical protein
MGKWVIDVYGQMSSFSTEGLYIIVRTSYISMRRWHIHFVLDQNTQLDFNRASSLNQHAGCGRHVALIEHNNLISSQTVFALTP